MSDATDSTGANGFETDHVSHVLTDGRRFSCKSGPFRFEVRNVLLTLCDNLKEAVLSLLSLSLSVAQSESTSETTRQQPL